MKTTRSFLLASGIAIGIALQQTGSQRIHAGLAPQAGDEGPEIPEFLEGTEGPDGQDGHESAVHGVLRAQRARGHELAPELVESLVEAARRDPAPIVEVVLSGVLPPTAGEPAPQTLNRYQLRLGLLALVSAPPGTVLAALPPAPQRTELPAPALGRMLGVLAVALPERDFGQLFELWAEIGEPASQRESLRAALAFALEHREELYARLADTELRLSPRTRIEVATVLGDRGSAEALPVLVKFLEGSDVPAHVMLDQMGRLEAPLLPDVAERIAELVVPWLAGDEAQDSISACRALGALGTSRGVEPLLELLRHESSAVAEAAHASLTRSSGMRLPADPRLWTEWYETERLDGGFDGGFDLEGELERVLRTRPAELAGELRKLTAHRLHRHRIAAGLVELLDRENQAQVLLACTVLGELESGVALDGLVRVARDHEGPAASAALAAIERISGREFRSSDEDQARAREAEAWWKQRSERR